MAMDQKKLGIIVGAVVVVVAIIIAIVMMGDNQPANTANEAAAVVAEKVESGQELSCDFDQLIGKPASEALTYLSGQGRKVRMIKEGQPVTMDYRPERVTVEHDDAQIVTAISCG